MRMIFIYLIIFQFLAAIQTDAANHFENREQGAFYFIPSHYNIELSYENASPIQSKIRISGKTQAKTKWLPLHTQGLGVNGSTIQVISQGAPVEVKEIDHEFSDSYSRLLIFFDKEIEALTPLEFYMEYTANHDKWLNVKDSLNKTQLLVNVLKNNNIDFSSTCSFMFPCFGSDLKSTFNMTITREMGYKSVTSGELVNTVEDFQMEEKIVEKYSWPTEVSPEMVSVAIFSNNYSYLEQTFGKEKKSVRVYAPKDDINKEIFKYAATISSKILTFYEEYFGTSERVSKVELFFVPNQTINLERWGINVYGYTTEEGINLIPTAQSESTNVNMIQHITKGLGKQWVGEWWDPEGEFILSESYPRYIEYLGLEAVGNDTTLSDLAIYTDLLETEGLSKFSAKSQLENSNKGALLIRSFEGVLTRNGVRGAVQLFLKHLWGLNDEADYFDLTEMVAGNHTWSDIVNVLVGFMNNEGIPLVRLSIENETNFAFKQEPFQKQLDYDKKEQYEEDSNLWLLPISFTQQLKSSQQNLAWLTPHENVTFATGNTSEIILVDPTATGYHRTFYDNPILLKRIQNQLEVNHQAIQPLARAKLISEYLSFAEENYCSYETALNLTRYLGQETNLVVWTAFLDKFSKLYSKFLSHPEYRLIENFLLPKIDSLLEELDHPSNISEELLREKLLFVSCRLRSQSTRLLQEPYCQTYAKDLFNEWKNKPNGISPLDSIFPPTLRPVLECSIVAYGGREALDFMFAKYQNLSAHVGPYPYGILSSLACAQDPDDVQYLLQKTLIPASSGGFPGRDGWYVINYLIDTPLPNGRAQVLPFLMSHFDQVVEKIGGGYSSIVPQLLRYVAEYFSTPEQRNEVEQFVKQHQDKLGNSTDTTVHLSQAFEVMDANIQWMNKYGKDILNWAEIQ